MICPAEALERLHAGNRRFVASVRDHSAVPHSERRKSLAAGQEPFAIVLGVEFAAARFGTPLVVVLGHSQCGAVLAALEELREPTPGQSRNLRSIVDRIRPSIEPLLTTELAGRPEEPVASGVRANIRAAAAHLRTGSEILENLVRAEKLLVVGAEYSLDSGVVEFFDGIAVGR